MKLFSLLIFDCDSKNKCILLGLLLKKKSTMYIFFRELHKMFKTYKAKCKLQALENHPNRFTGTVDDPDPNNWPAPLKLIEQVNESIKQFRVRELT